MQSPAAVLSAGLILGTAQAGVVLAIVSWRYVSAFENIARTGSAGLWQFLPLATSAAWAGAATAAVFVLLVVGALLLSIRTHLDLGPSVTRTASARALAPRRMTSRASDRNRTCKRS